MADNRKLIQLPGTAPSPEVVLHRTVPKLPRIRNVIVIIQWDDQSWDADFTAMTKGEFAMAARYFDHVVNERIFTEKA